MDRRYAGLTSLGQRQQCGSAGSGSSEPAGRSLSYHRLVEHHRKLAILVGGGPAPGINAVIGAATIRARLEGLEVVGLRDGFEWIMQGNIDHVTPLTIDAVSRIHFRGGSHIGISRANPTTSPSHLESAV